MKPIPILSFFILFGLIAANNCAAISSEIMQGEKVYQKYCQGGTGHTWHHPTVFLFQQIKNRKVNKASPMPPFSGILSDAEINAVIAYIKSLWPEDIRKKYSEQFNN
jgi:hypothetical protein